MLVTEGFRVDIALMPNARREELFMSMSPLYLPHREPDAGVIRDIRRRGLTREDPGEDWAVWPAVFSYR